MKRMIIGALAALAIGLGLATPAQADANSYIDTLAEADAFWDHTGSECVIRNDFCMGAKFYDVQQAMWWGNAICERAEPGKSRKAVIDSLTEGTDGLGIDPVVLDAAYDAATTHLCEVS